MNHSEVIPFLSTDRQSDRTFWGYHSIKTKNLEGVTCLNHVDSVNLSEVIVILLPTDGQSDKTFLIYYCKKNKKL